MAEIFVADIDFHRELRKGDTFTVVYEALTADGEPITWLAFPGRVLAAEFVNNGPRHTRRCGSRTRDGKGGYYGFDGQSKRRAFLASPMEFSRVTSGFRDAHAPDPEAVAAASRASTTARPPARRCAPSATAWSSSPAGRTATATSSQINHSNERATLYAHLSRIDVRKGPARRAGRAHRRRRRHRLGHRPAPALRVQSRTACSAIRCDGAVVGTCSARCRRPAVAFASRSRSVQGQIDLAQTQRVSVCWPNSSSTLEALAA